jgi:DNA-binding YbaB/EbfC family protein
LKDALLAEIKTGKSTLYSLAIAQAERIDVTGEALRSRLRRIRTWRGPAGAESEWIEAAAQRIAGKKIRVQAVQSPSPQAAAASHAPATAAAPAIPWDAPDPAGSTQGASSRPAGCDARPAFPGDRRSRGDAEARLESGSPFFVGRPGGAGRFPSRDQGRGGIVNIQAMMQQAKEMQERLQKQMSDMRVEATAGGGMVTVAVNGTKQLQRLTIDPEVVSKDDVEMLQDLIVAAINDANRKVDEQLGQSMSD